MRSELATVIVPKSSITEGKGRNNLANLLESAGYDKVRDGLDRQDTFTQGGIRFRGIKDAPTLASQFRNSNEGMGVIMGLDVLMEADFLAQREGTRFDIRNVLDLGIGNCSMYVLAPDEAPVLAPEDLADRTVFTKYPAVFRRLLGLWKQRARTEYATGAEIRANENREKPVAAFEIVESGGSARDNNLMIARKLPYPNGSEFGISYADRPLEISTNLYGTNIDWMSDVQRQKLTELGLALESSLRRNTFVSFEFMVPAVSAGNFSMFGIKGPTVSVVQSNDGQDWRAIKICVPQDAMNAVRRQLIERGAEGIVTMTGLLSEPDPSDSQVLKAMNAPAIKLESVAVIPLNEAKFLLELSSFIENRVASKDALSATVNAVKEGPEFCSAKCSEEVSELSLALWKDDRSNAIKEAADVVYRFIVALRSRSRGLGDISTSNEKNDSIQDSLAKIFMLSDTSGAEPSDLLRAMEHAWSICSTAIRKGRESSVADPAMQFLREFSKVLFAYEIALADVIAELQRRHKPAATK